MASDRVRILMIISGLELGGAERQLLGLMQALDREQFLPAVVSLSKGGPLAEDLRDTGFSVHELCLPSRLSDGARLVGIARSFRPHVIHGWMYHANVAASLTALTSGSPQPAVVHGVRASPLSAGEAKALTRAAIWLAGRLSYRASCVLYNAGSSAAAHEHMFRYCSAHRLVIPNGFDTDAFQPSPSARFSVRSEMGVPASAKLIGMIGRYDPMKDHQTFFEAAVKLKDRMSEVHFVLAGSGVSPDNRRLAQLAATLGTPDRVHFLGPRRDMPRVIAALDVLALTSAYGEACPNVLGEAMSCGVVCVSTSIGDAPILLGGCGYVVPPRDPDSVASALENALSLAATEREQRARAARTRILENYSVASSVRKHSELYLSLASRSRH